MKGTRGRGSSTTKGPVVVTFDADRTVLDVVGELGVFCHAAGRESDILAMLADLLQGGEHTPDAIQFLELDQGRYADVHVLREDSETHVVLVDVSAQAGKIIERQQASHDLSLERVRALRDAAPERAYDALQSRMGTLLRTHDVLGEWLRECTAVSSQMQGHAHVLAKACRSDKAAMRSIAAIQRAALRLQAVVAQADLSLEKRPPLMEAFDTSMLGAFIQDGFGLLAGVRGIALDVRVPEPPVRMAADESRLKQVLQCLVTCVLDGFEGDRLQVEVGMHPRRSELVVSMVAEPGGLSLRRMGELVTATRHDAWASMELVVARALLQQMQGVAGFDERRDGGCDLWLRVPVVLADATLPPVGEGGLEGTDG